MKENFDTILAKLKKKEYSPIYFLYGEEPLYIDKITQYIENEIIDEPNRDFNQAVFYGKDTEPEEVIASAKEFPFGVEYRVVIVKEAQNWPNLDAVVKYAENPLPSTILVICYKYSNAKKIEKYIKSLDKVATIFDSPKVATWNLGGWVEKCAQEHDFNIDSRSANLIAEHIGDDLTRIDNEFSKLRILFPEGTNLTPEIIEEHIGISKQYNIYELQDALENHNEVAAYKIIMAFCANTKNYPIIQVINSLYTYYNSLLSYQLAPKKDTSELKAIFGAKSPQYLQRKARIAMNFSTQSLIRIMNILHEFDARCKGVDNVAPDEELYKELIYKLLH